MSGLPPTTTEWRTFENGKRRHSWVLKQRIGWPTRNLVAKLERGRHDTLHATLAQFEELLDLHTADRERLRRELGRTG
jgi:hypothetical protein